MSKKIVMAFLAVGMWVGFSSLAYGQDDLEAKLKKAEKEAQAAKEASLKKLADEKAKKAEDEKQKKEQCCQIRYTAAKSYRSSLID